jgi:hypothetical protein
MHTASTYTCCSTATVPWRLHVQPPQMIMPAGKLAISCCRARFLTAATSFQLCSLLLMTILPLLQLLQLPQVFLPLQD